jgi:fused signal recognition particle receptor
MDERMNQEWMKLLEGYSKTYGTGDPLTDVISCALVISFMALVIGLLSYRRERGRNDVLPNLERLQSLGGRLERIEQTVNELRTDMLRQNELSKGMLEYIKQDVIGVREDLGELLSRKGGGSSGSGGSGSGGGNAPGTREVTKEELSEVRKGVIASSPSAENSGSLTPPSIPSEPQSVQELRNAPDAEAPTRESLFVRLKRSRESIVSKVRGFFGGRDLFDKSMIEDLEELLITSDVGVKTTMEIVAALEQRINAGEQVTEERLRELLAEHLERVLFDPRFPDGGITVTKPEDGPYTLLLVGVNGAGKTTTVAKLAHQWREQGLKVMVAAADTYRAAAVSQLTEWADRIGVQVVSGVEGAKPATVVFEAIVAAKRENADVLIIDTAGRLHNKASLMQELEGIKNALQRHQASAPHEVILVVDGASGQNALIQAREFNAAVPLNGVVITKLDGTPKGGIVVAIKSELNIPVRYIGIGEKREDLRPFDAAAFSRALVDREDEPATVRERAPEGGIVAVF